MPAASCTATSTEHCAPPWRQSEVEDLHGASGGNEDVLRLQIAVHEVILVRCGTALGGNLESFSVRLARQR